jgi:required for meiotic nuclear division protein 1
VLHECWWVPRWQIGNKEGEVFVFSNGSFVCWGLGEEEAEKFVSTVLKKAPGIEVAPLKEAETEELEFVTDHAEQVQLSCLETFTH